MSGDPTPEEPAIEDAARRKRRRQLILLLTPLSLAVILGYVSNALTPTLLQEEGGHPLLLLALDARNRNLILTAEAIDAIPFYLVAMARLFAVDPFTYLLGRRYGDTGLRWVEDRFASLKPTLEFLERLFRRAGWLAVALAPGAVMCTLAGAAGMSLPIFAVANIVGTVVRIYLLREVGEAFSEPVDAIRRFFDRYVWWTTAISILLMVLVFWNDRRRGAAQSETPVELADELEEVLEDAEAEAEAEAETGGDQGTR